MTIVYKPKHGMQTSYLNFLFNNWTVLDFTVDRPLSSLSMLWLGITIYTFYLILTCFIIFVITVVIDV